MNQTFKDRHLRRTVVFVAVPLLLLGGALLASPWNSDEPAAVPITSKQVCTDQSVEATTEPVAPAEEVTPSTARSLSDSEREVAKANAERGGVRNAMPSFEPSCDEADRSSESTTSSTNPPRVVESGVSDDKVVNPLVPEGRE